MIHYPQCWAIPFLIPIGVFQLDSVGCPHLYFLVLWNSHQCSAGPSSLVKIPLCLALLRLNKFITQRSTSWSEIIFPQIIILCPFPGNCVSFPLILWGPQKFRLLFQSLLYSLLHQYMIPCCCQHTMISCIDCLYWCYLLCTFCMYQPPKNVTLGSFNIYHTTVVHIPCIHK